VRTRDGIQGVVGMQHLRDLAGTDLDAGRCAQLVLAEDAVEHLEDQRMRRGMVEHPGLGEQRVHAAGQATLEVIAPARRRGEDRGELGASGLDLVAAEDTFDDRVAVLVQRRDDRVDRSSGLYLRCSHRIPPESPLSCGRAYRRHRVQVCELRLIA
jgi:hypothetical protein